MQLNKNEKIILTDCDGVVLDWEWAFNIWMQEHGFETIKGYQFVYDISQRYGISKNQGHKLIRQFNESATMGFLPALRDAQYYVKRLHEEHGYEFHAITSLSKNKNACKLRTMNLKKLFGKTAFTKFVYLGTGEDKDEALAPYQNTNHYWVEDKPANAEAGLKVGLRPLLIEHGHNMDYKQEGITTVKNWKQIYNILTDSDNGKQ